MNRVTLIGHLGADPELRQTDAGTAVCNLRMATSERWTGRDGERQERTEWHTVTVWGRVAENCKRYLRKGSKIAVEGDLRSRTWQADDGTERRTWFINAKSVEFLDSKRQTTPPAGGWAPVDESREGGEYEGGYGQTSGTGGGWGNANGAAGGWSQGAKADEDDDPIPF